METLTVSECVKALNSVLETQVLRVEGEVSEFRVSRGQLVFLTIKDEKSSLDCFALAYQIRQPIEAGMKIRVLGLPGLYIKSGRFRIKVEQIELVGEGALRRAFELLQKKLTEEALFSPARKRAVPDYPERVGLIASADSAAYSDFIKVLKARWGAIDIFFIDVPVQGVSSPAALARAVNFLNNEKYNLDAIVITRGGGSLEDLQSFNDEGVARAIFGSSIPVITGVGHERDVTISDMVADLRASTPSNAAELLAPTREDEERRLKTYVTRMIVELSNSRSKSLNEIQRFVSDLMLVAERPRQELRFSSEKLKRALVYAVQDVKRRQDILPEYVRRFIGVSQVLQAGLADNLKQNSERLQALHPRRILERGYTIVQSAGRIVKSKSKLHLSDKVAITFSDGEAEAEITNI